MSAGAEGFLGQRPNVPAAGMIIDNICAGWRCPISTFYANKSKIWPKLRKFR